MPLSFGQRYDDERQEWMSEAGPFSDRQALLERYVRAVAANELVDCEGVAIILVERMLSHA